jgi:hypothetical protein
MLTLDFPTVADCQKWPKPYTLATFGAYVFKRGEGLSRTAQPNAGLSVALCTVVLDQSTGTKNDKERRKIELKGI